MSYWPELRQSMMTAAHREYGAPSAARRRRPRMVPLPKLTSATALLASLAAIAVAVVALTVLHHRVASSGGAGISSAAVKERAARRAAADVLRQLVLPPGAVRTGLIPGTPADMWQPADLIATSHRVSSFGIWRLPQSPGRVLSFIQAHRPAGTWLETRSESGSGSGMLIDTATFIIRYRAGAATAVYRELALRVERLPAGGSALRADGEAGWMNPRSIAGLIPAAVDRVQVTKFRLGPKAWQPRSTVTITSAGSVHRLVALLNALPAAPPDVISLPRPDASRCVRARTGIGLVWYSPGRVQPVAKTFYIPSCGFMYLLVGGRSSSSSRLRSSNVTFLRVVSPISELVSPRAGLR